MLKNIRFQSEKNVISSISQDEKNSKCLLRSNSHLHLKLILIRFSSPQEYMIKASGKRET